MVRSTASAARDDDDALRRSVEACCEVARATGERQLLALRSSVAPGDGLGVWAASPAEERFYWERPAAGETVVGLGCADAVETDGEGRIRDAARELAGLSRRLHVIGAGAPAAAGPLWLGGFAFASGAARAEPWQGQPAGRLVLPELVLVRRGGSAWCSVVHAVEPGADADRVATALQAAQASALRLIEGAPSLRAAAGDDDPGEPGGAEYRVRADRAHAVYRAQVRAALGALAAGELEKVVLARSLEVAHPGRFDLVRFLESLREIHPTCVVFAMARRDDCFLAASPERLVALREGSVETGALAGTAARGRSPEEDERLGRELRESKKEQAEHAAVVHAVREALAGVCTPLAGPEAPRLMRIEGMQHLETPLRGRLRPEQSQLSVLDLVARLHPTPAVAGLPRESALAWIREHEGLDRGWYCGPVGFVDAAGDGEFRVALRSGFVRNGAPARAWLYAGAGIVSGSLPESELRETRLKLRALLAPLTEI